MKIGDEVYIHGYVDEIRQNVVIIRNDGGYFGTVAEEITSSSENPNTCGDVISRQAAIEAIEALQRPIMREESNYYQFKFSGMSEAREAVVNLPSVTPQQRTGRWIFADEQNEEDVTNDNYRFICSECQCSDIHAKGTTVPYCWKCGAKMEVEE